MRKILYCALVAFACIGCCSHVDECNPIVGTWKYSWSVISSGIHVCSDDYQVFDDGHYYYYDHTHYDWDSPYHDRLIMDCDYRVLSSDGNTIVIERTNKKYHVSHDPLCNLDDTVTYRVNRTILIDEGNRQMNWHRIHKLPELNIH